MKEPAERPLARAPRSATLRRVETPTSAVIFDLDGTLLDTEALYLTAAQQVCERHGGQYTLELKRKLMGGDALTSATIIIRTLGLPIDPSQYLAQREAALRDLWATVQPMPGASELVAQLVERGVQVAIATSGHRGMTVLKLRHHTFLASMKALVCGDDACVERGKPAPDIFLAAASALGVPPERCAAIEDSPNGVRASVAAGMRTIALLDARWGLGPEDFEGAAHCIGSLQELSLEMLGVL